jgi:outer membrane protein
MTRVQRLSVSWIVSVCTLISSPVAHAGVDVLLRAALTEDPALAAAHARTEAAAAAVGAARSPLLPRITATGGYTRNQVAAEVSLPGQEPVVITPLDQLEAVVRAEVPLFDASAIASTTAAVRCRDAAEAREEADVAEALLAVVQAAWDLRTAEEGLDASSATVEANRSLVEAATVRRAAGTGTALDVLRATADLERAREELALAGADRARASRALGARTGLSEVPGDLAPRPLATAGLRASDAPAVVAAAHDAACRVAERSRDRWGYAPTVSAFAQERLSNATGFAGRVDTWSAGVAFQWNVLDGGTRESRLASTSAALHEAEAVERQVVRAAQDALAQALDDATAASSARESAAARRSAAAEALRAAQERYEAGLGSAVDVSLAVRDDRDAALAFARAEARYALALEAARVAAGLPLVDGGGA